MKKLFFTLLPILSLSGCIRKFDRLLAPKALNRLSCGMDKEQVIQVIGEPDTKGSIIEVSGCRFPIFTYRVNKLEPPYLDLYFLYFQDNKLVKWCKLGDPDWKKNVELISLLES